MIDDKNFLKIKIDFVYIISTFFLISIFVFLRNITPLLELLKIIILIFSSFLIFHRKESFIYLIPIFVLIAPIFGSYKLFGFNFLISDLILFYTFALILFLDGLSFSISKKSFYIFLFLILFTFFHIVIGNILSFKPIFSLVELVILYWIYTKNENKIDLKLFNNYFIYSVLAACLLMIFSFYYGINLNDFSGDSNELILNKSEFNPSIYRMSFFYTNFPIIISFSIFIVINFLKEINKFHRVLFYYILLLFLLISLVVSGNKTAMLAVLLVFIFSFLLKNKNSLKTKIKVLILTFFLGSILSYLIINFFLNEASYDFFIYRMLSLDSLEDRIGVYVNAFYMLIVNPFKIFIGFGPDFFTCCGEPNLQNLFKINFFTGRVNNAIDSAIITFFIEFGVIIFSYFIIKIITLIKYAYNSTGNENLLFLQILIFLILYSLTQLIGLSKIMWIIIILISIINSNYKKWSQTK